MTNLNQTYPGGVESVVEITIHWPGLPGQLNGLSYRRTRKITPKVQTWIDWLLNTDDSELAMPLPIEERPTGESDIHSVLYRKESNPLD